MDPALRRYIVHKILSASTVIVLSVFSVLAFPAEQVSRWYVLLLALVVFGYGHFLIGGYYQLKSFTRKSEPRRWYRWFSILSLLSLIACLIFFIIGADGFVAVFVIGYFMLHGFFNEITLFEQQTGRTANRYTMAAISLALLGLILNAIGHASWFFTPDLTFVSVSGAAIQSYLTTDPMPLVARMLGLGSLVVATVIALQQAYKKKQPYFHLVLSVVFGLLGTVAIWWYPIHYMFMWAGLLLYHFVTWFLFFLVQFKERFPERLPAYLGFHVIAILPFLFLLFPNPVGIFVDRYFLNSYTFLVFTAIHISVSFLSEPWFQKRFVLQ